MIHCQRWRRGHNLRGQGLWKSPRPRAGSSCRGQADCLEAKDRKRLEAKDSRTRLKIQANINVNIVIMFSQEFKH